MTARRTTEAEDVVWLRSGSALPSAARREGTELARRVGLDEERIAGLRIALTEAATNLQRHAGDGALALRVVRFGDRPAVECLALDSGPGIADPGRALADGVSSAGTLGIGLGAIARLADSFDLYTRQGQGTALLAHFTVGDAPEPGAPGGPETAVVAGLTRPISGEQLCGDTWAAHEDAEGVTVMMCDGLGHGPLAARAAEQARAAFRGTALTRPEDLLRHLHSALKGTRGAAVAVARVDLATRRVALCGAGNIAGFVLTGTERFPLLSMPGIVGHQVRTLRTFEADLPTGALLILHSDGLRDRWAPADFPALPRHRPAVVAGHLLWQTGVRRDDAGIVVVKVPPA
ncbi:ATP-binding protein [Streptomyces sp. NPDC049879]|uniref:ATP-binding protein n=1 Tax=Streptomyces sp. NPDC049879 TaxID=3365598 RepID=UPI0037AE29AA